MFSLPPVLERVVEIFGYIFLIGFGAFALYSWFSIFRLLTKSIYFYLVLLVLIGWILGQQYLPSSRNYINPTLITDWSETTFENDPYDYFKNDHYIDNGELDFLNTDYVSKILDSDLKTMSEEQFYKDESRLIQGYSGSAGYFLDEESIQWLLKAEKAFRKRGIELKDYNTRHGIIGSSLFNMAKYKQALREFKNIGATAGIELIEWILSNGDRESGKLKIREYAGEILFDQDGISTVENDRYKFVSFFKGPVYRYDKKKNLHALIYSPASIYDWCTKLRIEGDNLIFRLRDYSEDHVFNNVTHELKSPSVTEDPYSLLFKDI